MSGFPEDLSSRWKPRQPSQTLRDRIFRRNAEVSGRWRLEIPWIRLVLVVASCWITAIGVATAPPSGAPPRSSSSEAGGHMHGLVAQNSLPAARFTFTNPPSFPATNRTF